MNKVVVRSENKRYGAFEREAVRAARAALAFLRKDGFLIGINLIADREARRLNRKFRKKNKIPNVLSFSEPEKFPHPESRLRPLGEIYLAPDFILRKREDFRLLTVHGILHLLGFSHEKGSDRMKMEKLERKIIQNV